MAESSGLRTTEHSELGLARPVRPDVGFDPRDVDAKNVSGSTAGAGSGDFHVYRQERRRELDRIQTLENEKRDRLAREAHIAEEWDRRQREESKTERRAGKRKRKKERAAATIAAKRRQAAAAVASGRATENGTTTARLAEERAGNARDSRVNDKGCASPGKTDAALSNGDSGVRED